MSAILRNSCIIEFDQLVSLLLRLHQLGSNWFALQACHEGHKLTCFEPPSLASISFVCVALLFLSLLRQLQPRLRIGEHTAPAWKPCTPHDESLRAPFRPSIFAKDIGRKKFLYLKKNEFSEGNPIVCTFQHVVSTEPLTTELWQSHQKMRYLWDLIVRERWSGIDKYWWSCMRISEHLLRYGAEEKLTFLV